MDKTLKAGIAGIFLIAGMYFLTAYLYFRQGLFGLGIASIMVAFGWLLIGVAVVWR